MMADTEYEASRASVGSSSVLGSPCSIHAVFRCVILSTCDSITRTHLLAHSLSLSCTHARTPTRMRERTHACMHALAHAHAQAHTHAHAYTLTYAHTHRTSAPRTQRGGSAGDFMGHRPSSQADSSGDRRTERSDSDILVSEYHKVFCFIFACFALSKIALRLWFCLRACIL